MFNSRTFRSIARTLDTMGLTPTTVHMDSGVDDLAIVFHAIAVDDCGGYVNVTGAVAIDGLPAYDQNDQTVAVSEMNGVDSFGAAFGVFTMAVASTTI